MAIDRLVQATLTFFNEGERYGEHVFYVQTDLDDTTLEARRHELAALSPLDDDRLPDRSFEIELEEVEEAPVGEPIIILENAVPRP